MYWKKRNSESFPVRIASKRIDNRHQPRAEIFGDRSGIPAKVGYVTFADERGELIEPRIPEMDFNQMTVGEKGVCLLEEIDLFLLV